MKGIAIINVVQEFNRIIKTFSLLVNPAIATVDTFANSDGCKNVIRLYQLRAPLTMGAIEVGTKKYTYQ